MSESSFGGVSLSELNAIAKSVYHGEKVIVDQWGFLVFLYTSTSGKTQHQSQMKIDEYGKLVKLTDVIYPNQWETSADAFVEKANGTFTFKK